MNVKLENIIVDCFTVNGSTESSSAFLGDPFTDEEDDEMAPPIPDPTLKSYILLTAPTGKAAKVLGRRTGFTGFTLHQVGSQAMPSLMGCWGTI